MNHYDFTVILSESDIFEGGALLDYADRLFPPFRGDVTPAVRNGVPVVICHVEAATLEAAIRRVLDTLRTEGLHVARLEMDSKEMAGLQAA